MPRSLRILCIAFCLAAVFACRNGRGPGASDVNSDLDFLTLAWETDTVFRTPESVLYDPAFQRLYVSNIGSNSWRVDGDGFISVMDTTGAVINLRWSIGLSGPKGMGISGAYLYVADIDRVCRIDRQTGAVLAEVVVPEGPAAQLNDIAVDDNGTVFVSGSGSEAIYMLIGDRLVRVFGLENGDIGRPNGLLWSNGRLYMAGSRSGRFSRVDMESGTLLPLADSLGTTDGIVPDGAGGFFVSDWQGRIFHLDEEERAFERTLLADWRREDVHAADLECLEDNGLLLVPTFFDNRVRAFRYRRR